VIGLCCSAASTGGIAIGFFYDWNAVSHRDPTPPVTPLQGRGDLALGIAADPALQDTGSPT